MLTPLDVLQLLGHHCCMFMLLVCCQLDQLQKLAQNAGGKADGNPERIKYANVSSYGDKEAGCAAYSLRRATNVQTPRRANRTPKLHGT